MKHTVCFWQYYWLCTFSFCFLLLSQNPAFAEPVSEQNPAVQQRSDGEVQDEIRQHSARPLFSTSYQQKLASADLPGRQFMVEMVSAISLDAGDALALFGPSLAIRLDRLDSVGMRGLLPFDASSAQGKIGQLFWRHHFARFGQGLFAELLTSFGLRNSYSSLGLGGQVGWSVRLSQGFSAALAAGLTWKFVESFGGGEILPGAMTGLNYHF